MQQPKNLSSFQAGFSLLEMACVVAVVGLLITGVFKGQELVEQSRLRKTIAQLEAGRAAVANFYERYGAFPGELLSTEELLIKADPTWDADRSQTQPPASQTTEVPRVTINVPNARTGKMFWRQLYQAGLVMEPDKFVIGQWCPSIPLGGVLVYTALTRYEGRFLALVDLDGGALLSPGRARALLAAYGQKVPIDPRGFVVMNLNGNPNGECLQGKRFQKTSKKVCSVYFFLCD